MDVMRTTITVLFIMFHTLIKEQQALNLQDYSNYINEKKKEINKKLERVRKLNEEVVEYIEASCQDRTCNFDESMCDFEQDKNDKFIWTRRKGAGASDYTEPTFDHTTGSTTGYYMYIDTSGLRQCVESVKLSSSPLKFLRNMCLKFYYRMDGADAGSLNVTIDGKLLFSASDQYVENIWLEAGINTSSITGSLMGTHRVTFEAFPGKGQSGGIAIDDFSFTAGSCPLSLPCDSNAPIGISDPSIISDAQMNASSQHDSLRYKPYYGRLHDKRGGGWCPSPTSEGNDSLQIDLRDTFVVCAVATQGNRDGKTLTTAFKLSYSSDGKKWKFYKYGDCSEKEFQRKGRSDDVDKYILPVQIHARFIRFHPTNRHNRSCLRVEVFGTRDFSSNSFQKYQDLPTIGAVAVVQFTINGNQFLAFANSDTDGFNKEPFIYKMNNFTEKFSLHQTINTAVGTDMEYFTVADTHYLAVVNFESGSTRRVKLVIYQWNGQFFVVFQNITSELGSGNTDLNFIKVGTEPFLTIVNVYYQYTHYWIAFELYKWRNNSFDMYEVGAGKVRTYTPYGASTEFVIKNETFLVVAAGNHLYVLKWIKGLFQLFSPVRPIQLTYGARDVKSFKMNGQIFLAIANFDDGTKPTILKWNGNEFVPYQSLFTTEAIAWHPFVMCSETFLSVADNYGKSFVYRAIGSRFFKFQELSTQGAHGMTSFGHGGHTYLVVANSNINSTVYKFK